MAENLEDRSRLTAETRTEFGKGFARRLRASGKTPVVLYGKGQETLHLIVPAHALFLAVKGNPKAELTVTHEGTEYKVRVQDIQRDPVTTIIEHVDLLVL